MTNRLPPSIALSVVLTTLTAAWTAAQTPVQWNFLGHGTELGGLLGAAVTSSEMAPMVGGTAGWGINPWVTVEARAAWFARGEKSRGLGGDVGALVNVVRKRQVTPYVGLAFGLYRESIDSDARRVSGFYRRRMLQDARGGVVGVRTFTDSAWRVGAGIGIARHRNLSLRPEASVTLVHRNGATDAITTFGIRVGWIFEDHPVTPSVRSHP